VNEDARIARVRDLIVDVPDFPKPGIIFKDITPVLANPQVFAGAIEVLHDAFRTQAVDAVVAIESRGFFVGAPLALALGAAFIPVRKPGKLPRERDRVDYTLEYGTDALEMHRDALEGRGRVLLVDDVIATGGTAQATQRLIAGQGATVVGAAFLIDLAFLGGSAKLAPVPSVSLLRFD